MSSRRNARAVSTRARMPEASSTSSLCPTPVRRISRSEAPIGMLALAPPRCCHTHAIDVAPMNSLCPSTRIGTGSLSGGNRLTMPRNAAEIRASPGQSPVACAVTALPPIRITMQPCSKQTIAWSVRARFDCQDNSDSPSTNSTRSTASCAELDSSSIPRFQGFTARTRSAWFLSPAK